MSRLTDFLFPPLCVSCEEPLVRGTSDKTALCPECRAEWEKEKLKSCRFCGREMIDCRCMNEKISRTGCSALLKLCSYRKGEQRTVKSLVFCLKRDAISRCENFLSAQLALLIRGYLKEARSTDFIVTSVPRRKASVREYGYDHAALIARLAAERIGLAYVPLLCRVHDGEEQKYLSSDEREDNVRRAFSESENAKKARERKIILVDDVVTTGSSMAACASLLFSEGAENVVCACIALAEKS